MADRENEEVTDFKSVEERFEKAYLEMKQNMKAILLDYKIQCQRLTEENMALKKQLKSERDKTFSLAYEVKQLRSKR